MVAVSLLASGCSRERTRVVEEPSTPQPDGRDYRGMLDRVRARQTPVQIQYELETAIRRFQHDLARLPTNLMELVARRYIPALKNPPEGYGYTYDPIHGNVGVIPMTGDGMTRLPEHLQSGPQRIDMSAPALPAPAY